MFEDPTTTGVAILIPEHMLVADVDTEEAATLLMELAGETPETPVARTAHGLHIWYVALGADASVWIGGRTLLFKGFGGYVVAPPSNHYSDDGTVDAIYEWINPLDVGFELLPEGVEQRIHTHKVVTEAVIAGTPDGPQKFPIVTCKPEGGFTIHAGYNLGGLVKAIIDAPDGNQNNIIAWATMVAKEEGVPYDVAVPLLLDAAIKGGHPKDRAETTIRGVFTRKSRG